MVRLIYPDGKVLVYKEGHTVGHGIIDEHVIVKTSDGNAIALVPHRAGIVIQLGEPDMKLSDVRSLGAY